MHMYIDDTVDGDYNFCRCEIDIFGFWHKIYKSLSKIEN